MEKRKSIIGGIILISVGVLILLAQLIPGLGAILDFGQLWPLILVGIGVLFIFSAFFGNPDLAIPGSILTGLGAIFYYQNITGNWGSWAFVWTLIPGFVGIGMVLTGLLDKTRPDMKREGGRLIFISAALFLVFSFFFNFSWNFSQLWPLLLIGGGIWLLIQNRRGKKA